MGPDTGQFRNRINTAVTRIMWPSSDSANHHQGKPEGTNTSHRKDPGSDGAVIRRGERERSRSARFWIKMLCAGSASTKSFRGGTSRTFTLRIITSGVRVVVDPPLLCPILTSVLAVSAPAGSALGRRDILSQSYSYSASQWRQIW